MLTRSRIAKFLPIVAAFLAVMLVPHTVGAETDAERERERVRQQQNEVAASVNALEADHAEVSAALTQLEDQVRSEQAALESAQREVQAAEAARDRAQKGIEEAEAALTQVEDQLRAAVVEAYTSPDDSSFSVLDASTATDMVTRRALLDNRAASDEDLVDQVRLAQAELRTQRRAAEAAGERAEAKRQEVEARLAGVEEARDNQANFAAQVQERINAETNRAVELASTERELSAQIAREQAELQARLRWAAMQEAARERDAAAAAAAREEAAEAAQGPSYDDNGREESPGVATPAPPPPPSGPAGSGHGGISLCNAAGITVNCQISSQVSSMVAAAAADGVTLAGGGYRDPSRQIALREQHCGSSYYAIYQMPSSQCRPPTARPGSSQHEVGLAIDFSNCSSRGTACFGWLSRNASRFGMYNLPSEPWHWSVNGN